MKKIIFSVFMLFILFEASSQTYMFDSIPSNLRIGADAVVRTEQCLYKIIKPGNAVMKVRKAVTLLNDNSKSYRFLTVYYDKFSKVNYLKGVIYDEKGMLVKALGLDDQSDMSAITGSSFYSDDRMKTLRFPIYKYPYTIEYEYEIEFTSLINYPSWSFQDSPDVSVEKSGIQFIVPKEMKLRYYAENLKNPVDSIIDDKEKIYTWQEENLPAIPFRQLLARQQDSLPVVHTAPLYFDYGGFKGSMESWKTFGDWVFNLTKGLDVLPESENLKVAELVSGINDPRERVKKIYEYVQSKTRYVSIQIGIGGYRPAEAAAVARNGFGDCKALVNYTMALLKAANINSIYTLVLAGDEKPINTGFVDNQFNHVILCVPMQKDTVWLDCTDQTLPFNFLGDFTSDRHALLVKPEGSKIVRTPGFSKKENITSRQGSVFLNILGTSSAKISNVYSGINYSTATSLFSGESEDELKRYLNNNLHFTDFNVTAVSYREEKTEKPKATFYYEMSVTNFAHQNGKRIYFNPSLTMGDYLLDLPATFEISESLIFTDSIGYNLPLGYKIDYIPENVSIENEFAKYKYQLQIIKDKVIYRRYLEVSKGIITLKKYNEFRDFINTVAKTDRKRIILTRSS